MANNGREALELLEKQPFDLALVDVQMPEMDGLQLTGAIREKEKEHPYAFADNRYDRLRHEG